MRFFRINLPNPSVYKEGTLFSFLLVKTSPDMRTAIFTSLIFFTFPAYNQTLFRPLPGATPSQVAGDSRSVNLVDIDGDGRDDIFISNGPKGGQNNLLFLNRGQGQFEHVTGAALVNDQAPSDGATFADFDNDGDLDVVVVTWYGAPNIPYRNDGNLVFTPLPDALPGAGRTFSETAAWGDYNGDGLVDLYMTNSEGDKHNLLYRNLGSGRFERVDDSPAVADTLLSRGVNWIDYDGDNDLDLFITNEQGGNQLFRNDKGNLLPVPGVLPQAGNFSTMSASWGDIDNDGDPDLFLANAGYYSPQPNQLLRNDGGDAFTDITPVAMIQDGGCSYGSAFADYDNDGDLDLAVSNGFCTGDIHNFLYRNDGAGNFSRDTSSIADFRTPCSFGLAWSDLNDDGFPDLVVATCRNRPQDADPANQVWLNQANGNHWLQVQLTGEKSNRSAVGARVRVYAAINGRRVGQTREISAQSGYCGQNSLTAHFGLGDATTARRIIVDWPAGGRTVLRKQGIDQRLSVVER